MKKTILLTIILNLFLIPTQAQNYSDVVYLKNGSIIRGVIIEQIPNQTIKIQTKDRNVFVFSISEIEKITKEDLVTKTRKRYPGSAFAFSLLFPGAGQMYNQQYTKGAIMMALETIGTIGIVVAYTQDFDPDGAFIIADYVLIAGNIVWSLIDAPVSATRINRRNGLSLNYNTNNNIQFSLKPSYGIACCNGKNNPIFGAKLFIRFN